MSLITLRVCNPEQLPAGVAATQCFGPRGGTLGSLGCDWLLPDHHAQARPLHCEIRWLENGFCMLDHCRHTYLGTSTSRAGRTGAVKLRSGDTLRIGRYQIAVDIVLDGERPRAQQANLQAVLTPGDSPLDALLAQTPARDNAAPEARVGRALAISREPCRDPLQAVQHAAPANNTHNTRAWPC